MKIEPIEDRIEALASRWGFEPSPELSAAAGAIGEEMLELIGSALGDGEIVENVAAERSVGQRPSRAEDPYNAIARRCRVVAEAPTGGLLKGVRVSVKDSISIGGIPITAGSEFLGSYVPPRDSVVVERVLAAGGEIVAVTTMDDLALSVAGDACATGTVRNPHDPGRVAGGSSAGAAAGLFYEGIDVALGTDQGGSVRVPASCCGVIGHKPTFGLVPYTGALGLDPTLDHIGPLGRSAEQVARLLEAIAGPHPADPRTRLGAPARRCLPAVEAAPHDFAGVRVGVLTEGFDPNRVEPATAAAVRAVAAAMGELGARVTEVSLPDLDQAAAIAYTCFSEGFTALMAAGGNAYGAGGRYDSDLAARISESRRCRGAALPPQAQIMLVVGEHLRQRYGGEVYARAQNARQGLRQAVDRALGSRDLLLLPTTPGPAQAVDERRPLLERIRQGWAPGANALPFNVTGHPAISLPAAAVDGLPQGVMLVAAHHADAALLAHARTLETTVGWAAV